MVGSLEKKQKSKKEKINLYNKNNLNNKEKESLEWTHEFSRLRMLVRRMLHQLEQDVDAIEPLPESAAAKKAALAERNSILTSVAKLVQLFSELFTTHQQLQKISGGEEEMIVITEADMEAVEQYFKKCREMGMPLLGTSNRQ